MPKYYGSDQAPRAPFVSAVPQSHTPEQIRSWWDAMAQGLREDIQVSRDPNREPHVLFVLQDDGRLGPAVQPGEDPGSPQVRGRMLDQSRAGRLFIRGLDDEYPRQVITDDQHRVAVTTPTNTLPAPEGSLPPQPRRPFFLKFLLPFLFREELDAYAAKKQRYDRAVQRREMVQNFHDNVKKPMKESIAREAGDPEVAQRKEVRAKALSEAWEQKKARAADAKQAAEEEWMKNPSKDTLGIFENHLRDMSVKDFSTEAQSRLNNQRGTVGEYCKTLAQMLERQVAIPLLEQLDTMTDPAARDAFLLQHQDNYIKMMKNLKTFVPTQIDTGRLQSFLQKENPTYTEKKELLEELGNLAANGMTAYRQLHPPKADHARAASPELQSAQLQHEAQQHKPHVPFA